VPDKSLERTPPPPRRSAQPLAVQEA